MLTRLVNKLRELIKIIFKLPEKLEEIKINQGVILSQINETRKLNNLHDFEFKIFSQWGDDGIIQKLIKTIDVKNKTFVEFGVEDFSESNCRFLMMNNNWSGFVIDGSERNIKRLQTSEYYWKHDLSGVSAFIDKDNINELLLQSGFDEDLGILSIDIDGVDYYILDAITAYKPRIIICEYNSVFGLAPITVPYNAKFVRTEAHYSNLYFGASLSAISYLAKKKGYSLIGSNSVGLNAYFVRNDLINDQHKVLTPEQAYIESKFSESRDRNGRLSLLKGTERMKLIEDMPVVNVETGIKSSLKEYRI